MTPGIRLRIFSLCLPAMLVPPLWVGYQANKLERDLAQNRAETEIRGQVEAAERRLVDHLQRITADLFLLSQAPSLTDFLAFRELGLDEEAEVHRRRIEETADTLLAQSRILVAAGFLAPNGAIEAWKGPRALGTLATRALERQEEPPTREQGRNEDPRRLPLREEGRWMVQALPLSDKWQFRQGWAILVLDLRELLTVIGSSSSEASLLLFPPDTRVPLYVGSAPPLPEAASRKLLDHLRNWGGPLPLLSLEGPTWRDAMTLVPGRGLLKDWRILARIADESLFAGASRVRIRTAQLILLAFLFASLLAAWIAARLGGRIMDLARQAELIGEGRFDLPDPDPRQDELGILSQTLFEMSNRIQESQRALAGRIRDLEAARRQLIQAEKLSAIGQLSSGLAHEIHSPLQSVSAASSVLRQMASQGDIDPEELEELAQDIRESVAHATRITSGLQDYSRTAKETPVRKHFPLIEAVRASMNMLRGRKDVHRIRFQDSSQAMIQGDPTQVTQVVLNLILNALDADLGGAPVVVEVSEACFLPEEISESLDPDPASTFRDSQRLSVPLPGDAAVYLSVTDKGPGIPAADLPRIFDPFFTTKPAGSGTGLGLSITQGLVWSHGGIILIDTHPGEGTQVVVKFPVVREEPAPL